MGLSRGTSVKSGSKARLGFANGLPRQHPSSSHHSIFVSNLLVHNVENFVIQPRMQLCPLCSAKELRVLIRHLPLVNFNSFLFSTRYGEDLQNIRRAFVKADHLIGQDFNDQFLCVWDRDTFWFKHNALFGHPVCRCDCCSLACCCCCCSIGKVGFVVSVVGGCCSVRSCCLGGGPCAFLESGSSAPKSHHHFSHVLLSR